MTYRPRNRIVEIAAPSGAVVSVDDLREHVRMTGVTTDDSLLEGAEKAAVSMIEMETGRLLISRQVILRLPDLPQQREPIELPGGDVSAVASVVADGVAVTGAAAYGRSPAVLVPGSDWPAVEGQGYPVTITYTAGFATVPGDIVQAIKLLVGHYHLYTEAIISGTIASELPLGVESLIRPHRILQA